MDLHNTGWNEILSVRNIDTVPLIILALETMGPRELAASETMNPRGFYRSQLFSTKIQLKQNLCKKVHSKDTSFVGNIIFITSLLERPSQSESLNIYFKLNKGDVFYLPYRQVYLVSGCGNDSLWYWCTRYHKLNSLLCGYFSVSSTFFQELAIHFLWLHCQSEGYSLGTWLKTN